MDRTPSAWNGRIFRARPGTDAQVGAQPDDTMHRRVFGDQPRSASQGTRSSRRGGARVRIGPEPNDQLLLLGPEGGEGDFFLAREVEVKRAFCSFHWRG